MKNNKIIFMLICIVSIFGLIINVTAEENPCTYSSSGDCSNLISNYTKGKTLNINVQSGTTTPDNVTVYGKSVCTGTSCDISYSNYNSYEELLKNRVVCSGGEKYINIQDGSSPATAFKTPSSENPKNGTFYFSEKYSVTCTGTAVAGAVELSNDSSSSSSSSSTSSESSSSTNTNVTTGSGQSNPETGIETYYIILGCIGLLAYLVTVKIKKHNLFKNI